MIQIYLFIYPDLEYRIIAPTPPLRARVFRCSLTFRTIAPALATYGSPNARFKKKDVSDLPPHPLAHTTGFQQLPLSHPSRFVS